MLGRALGLAVERPWGGEGTWGYPRNSLHSVFSPVQMVLLWSTELFPSPEDWQDLEGSVYRLLVVLLRCLATQRLPHFLHPEQNLFQGDPHRLALLYPKVEAFAWDPARFLRFHFGLPARADGVQADPALRALLHLPAKDGTYWDTAYFDVLLSQVTGREC